MRTAELEKFYKEVGICFLCLALGCQEADVKVDRVTKISRTAKITGTQAKR